jgi:hypothetical protein
MASKGVLQFLKSPPVPISFYSVVSSTTGATLTKTKSDKTPFKLSIAEGDTLRLERTMNGDKGPTERLVVALASIMTLGYSSENELVILVEGGKSVGSN